MVLNNFPGVIFFVRFERSGSSSQKSIKSMNNLPGNRSKGSIKNAVRKEVEKQNSG